MVFYTIDGKQPGHSVGATLTQVAQRLIELGCVEAACLDGGGSTTLGVTAPDSNSFAGVNRPADGRQRANSTALFLTSTVPATGVLDHLYVTPGAGRLLSGARVQMKAGGVDTAWYPTALGADVEWSVDGGLGSVDGNGVFTAGPVSEMATVTAVSGGAAGAASFTVVDTPDTLTISRESGGGALSALYLAPGEQVDLKGTAVYDHLPLTAQDTCFVWTADPAAGTVDENGVFTAAVKSGAGTLTVSAGLKSVMIPVVVTGHIRELETFEQNIAAFTAGNGMALESESAPDCVARGRGSLRLSYDAAGGAADAASTLAIPAGEKYLSLWVYGDGSGNQLTAAVNCGGSRSDLHLTALNFTGWRRVDAALPEGATGLAALRIIYAGGEAKTGSIWIDHLTTANEALADETAPSVTITRAGNSLTALVTDRIDHTFSQDRISLTVDGKPRAFAWKPETGTLTATLAVEDGKSHRITVTARDSAGNLGRASLSVLPQREESPFVDTEGHWAAPFAQYLYDMDVSKGAPVDGGMAYFPNNLITRGEAFTMIARWLVDDLTRYENVELPFDDADAIPAWALNEVKAMVALGMVKGGGGKLNFSGVMSRTEAMVLLGRIQAKGYASADLSGFVDGDKVPAWAADYVRSLVGQGIVNGAGGWLNPVGPITRGEMAKLLMDIQ